MSNEADEFAQQAILNVNQLKALAVKYQQEAQQYQQESYDSNEQLRQSNEKIELLMEERDGLNNILHYSILEQDDYLSYAQDMLQEINRLIESSEIRALPDGKTNTLRETLKAISLIRERNANGNNRKPNDPPKRTLKQAIGLED